MNAAECIVTAALSLLNVLRYTGICFPTQELSMGMSADYENAILEGSDPSCLGLRHDMVEVIHEGRIVRRPMKTGQGLPLEIFGNEELLYPFRPSAWYYIRAPV